MTGLPILLARDDAVVLNKPAGLAVHAGPRGGASVEDWFPQLTRRRTGPWLAHRLDADTAGCLLVALRRATLLAAQALFAAGQVEKLYWAVVAGAPPSPAGTIDAPLAKRTRRAGWRMVVAEDGAPARTTWQVLGAGAGRAWLALAPQTGRTHQIRAHCAHLGCPILGDPLYGAQIGDASDRLHLLARTLRVPLPAPIAAEAPPPEHMRAALRQLGWAG